MSNAWQPGETDCTKLDKSSIEPITTMKELIVAEKRPISSQINHGIIEPIVIKNDVASDIDFSGISFFGTHFINTTFERCYFDDLRGVSFVNCKFDLCDFTTARLIGSYVHASSFKECIFKESVWTGAEVSKCIFKGDTPFEGCLVDTYCNSVDKER